MYTIAYLFLSLPAPLSSLLFSTLFSISFSYLSIYILLLTLCALNLLAY